MRCDDPECRDCNPRSEKDEILIVIARGAAVQAAAIAEHLGEVASRSNENAEDLAQVLKEMHREQIDAADHQLADWTDWPQLAAASSRISRSQRRRIPEPQARPPPRAAGGLPPSSSPSSPSFWISFSEPARAHFLVFYCHAMGSLTRSLQEMPDVSLRFYRCPAARRSPDGARSV